MSECCMLLTSAHYFTLNWTMDYSWIMQWPHRDATVLVSTVVKSTWFDCSLQSLVTWHDWLKFECWRSRGNNVFQQQEELWPIAARTVFDCEIDLILRFYSAVSQLWLSMCRKQIFVIAKYSSCWFQLIQVESLAAFSLSLYSHYCIWLLLFLSFFSFLCFAFKAV